MLWNDVIILTELFYVKCLQYGLVLSKCFMTLSSLVYKMSLFRRWLYHTTQQVKTKQIFVITSIYFLYLCAIVLYDLIYLFLTTPERLNRDLGFCPRILGTRCHRLVLNPESDSRVSPCNQWALLLYLQQQLQISERSSKYSQNYRYPLVLFSHTLLY